MVKINNNQSLESFDALSFKLVDLLQTNKFSSSSCEFMSNSVHLYKI